MSPTTDTIPDEAPPSYDAATSSNTTTHPSPSHLSPHQNQHGIPPEYRRSMEDEGRPLPSGWLRQFDSEHHHQFFVDTNRDPPRSIWQHPYDDEEYLNSLDPQARHRVKNLLKVPSQADIEAMSSDDEDHHHAHQSPAHGQPNTAAAAATPQEKPSFGRKLKDKLTNTTHEQREAQRQQRIRAEQQAYERHRQLRQAMSRAIDTGQPQHIGKDRDGRDLYIEPPQRGPGMMQPGGGGYGYNPYSNGPYASPNARYLRPAYPYGRPYGRGYGGGYGLRLAGGMLGGMLLRDGMFGGCCDEM